MKKLTYVDKVYRASSYIRSIIREKSQSFVPRVAVVLGSGLGHLDKEINAFIKIPYDQIPYHPKSHVSGHKGILYAGFIEKVPVLLFSGRVHYYEFGSQQDGILQVVFPVHLAANLGCKLYMATNAAGGLNEQYTVGDLMLVKSHISFFIHNPLTGHHLDFGTNVYFQPMHEAYDESYRMLFKKAFKESASFKIKLYEGVYAAVTGRTYETSAESQMLRKLGVDAVGMSTVPEVIAATNRGMDTLALSLITNVIDKDGQNKTNHDEVQNILSDADRQNSLIKLFRQFFRFFNQIKKTS